MGKKNKKPIVFIALLFGVLLIVGGTIAYYTSSDTFNNEFNAGTYEIETQEAFVSPDNWTPGTTTPKTVIATNKGSTPAAVRIKLTPSWVASDGVTTLPLTDGTNEAAIINYAFDKDIKWIYQDGYYYYIRPLEEGESTSSIIESVTFNPNVTITSDKDCTTVDGVTTCTTESTGYGDATYKLKVEIETAQYDQYKNVWNTTFNIDNPERKTGTLMKQATITNNNQVIYTSSKVFGNSNINPFQIESINTLDVIEIPNNAIDSWDCSEEQNESIMCWYTNVNNNSRYELYIGQEGGVKANPNSSYDFSYFSNSMSLNMQYLDTSNVTTMNNMFTYTGYGDNVDLFYIKGLENWDTSKVTDMSYMFKYVGRTANNWTIGDLSNWDTSKVTDMKYMFERAAYLAYSFDIGNIGNWDVSNVEDMTEMFSSTGLYAKIFSIGDLSNWDTSKVVLMTSMFDNAAYDAITWNDIGTLKIHANTISRMFASVRNAKATLNIYNNPSYYDFAFRDAATKDGAGIVVNYSNATTSIDEIIATKSYSSNITKGSQLD